MERSEISCNKIYNLYKQGVSVHVRTLDIVRSNGYNRNVHLWRCAMFDYMTAQEAAEKWNVSLRWVQRLCKGKRIDGAMNINRVWLIPKDAEKPLDGRLRTNKQLNEKK